MKTITVYSKASCAPCQTLKYWLNKKGLDYAELSLDDPAVAAEAQKISGYVIAPVITVDDEVVVGANLRRLAELV